MGEQGGTVLVVDDSPAIVYQLFEALKDNYQVLVATNGSDGMEVAATQSPDVILLDVMMPGLNGYDVCALLKENPRTHGIPVIFITARDDEEDEARGLALGAIDYLAKPLRPAIVRARVKNHIELKRSRDLLQRLTMLDPLTAIANRRRFDDFLATEWGRAARERQPMALAMIDVDDFKRYNDRYGHALGDQCLFRVAAALESAIRRPGDLIARYGGEEFACVLPNTDLIGAIEIAERMRAAVETLAIPHERSTAAPHVTISIGVTATVPDIPLLTTAALLIETADAALYGAKHTGRNRVREADVSPPFAAEEATP